MNSQCLLMYSVGHNVQATLPSTLYSVLCTLYSVLIYLYSVLCTLYPELISLYSVLCTLYSLLYSVLCTCYFTLYSR